MGEWAKRVAKALRDSSVQSGIATLVARYSKDHIKDSVGRGATGQETALKPLASVKGEYWTTRKPRDMSAVKQTRRRKVVRMVKRGDKTVSKAVEVTEYLLSSESYRTGGKPLRDTGEMMRQMGAKCATGGKGMVVTLYGPLHAIFHEKGFSTNDANYIPLTMKGKRQHAKGGKPPQEGLLEGKDYIIARRGVTVPARPFMVPTNNEWVEIGKSIRMGLNRILKGRK